MNKRFLDIVNNVANDIQDTSQTFKTLAKNWVNHRYFEFLRKTNFHWTRDDYTISVVAGTSEYLLPYDFAKFEFVLDKTNNLYIGQADRYEEGANYPSSATNIRGYYIKNDTVANQPASSSTLSVVSSNAADTTQVVFIKGYSGDVEITEDVTLSGTSAQTTTNSFSRITSISKDGNTFGKIAVTAGSVTIGEMGNKQKAMHYKKMVLFDTPGISRTLTAPYQRTPEPMVDDNDYPVLAGIDDIIEIGAKADAYDYKKKYMVATKFEMKYEKLIMDYIYDKENDLDFVKKFKPVPYSRNTTGSIYE